MTKPYDLEAQFRELVEAFVPDKPLDIEDVLGKYLRLVTFSDNNPTACVEVSREDTLIELSIRDSRLSWRATLREAWRVIRTRSITASVFWVRH